MAASPSYAMGQLRRAIDSLAAAQDAAGLGPAETKIARWRSVLAGMAEGSLSVGFADAGVRHACMGDAGGRARRFRDRPPTSPRRRWMSTSGRSWTSLAPSCRAGPDGNGSTRGS